MYYGLFTKTWHSSLFKIKEVCKKLMAYILIEWLHKKGALRSASVKNCHISQLNWISSGCWLTHIDRLTEPHEFRSIRNGFYLVVWKFKLIKPPKSMWWGQTQCKLNRTSRWCWSQTQAEKNALPLVKTPILGNWKHLQASKQIWLETTKICI